MSKSNGRIRRHLVGLAVAASLVAMANAAFDNTPLTIVAPNEVFAGTPICGYVTGADDMCSINAWSCGANGIFKVGPTISGFLNPIHFVYPTLEPWAPGLVTIHAADGDESLNRNVLLK